VQLKQVQEEMEKQHDKETQEFIRKRAQLKQGIDDVKYERDTLKKLEMMRQMCERPQEYFPFTHGDHIER